MPTTHIITCERHILQIYDPLIKIILIDFFKEKNKNKITIYPMLRAFKKKITTCESFISTSKNKFSFISSQKRLLIIILLLFDSLHMFTYLCMKIK